MTAKGNRSVRALSLIVRDEHCLLDVEEARNLAWLLRNLETPYEPDIEIAGITAAVIAEDTASRTPVGSLVFTAEEERAMLSVLDRATKSSELSTRLTRLHRALKRSRS
jgi:hypothetical protein